MYLKSNNSHFGHILFLFFPEHLKPEIQNKISGDRLHQSFKNACTIQVSLSLLVKSEKENHVRTSL